MGYQLSYHRSAGWKGQLERVKRWHTRVKEAARNGSDDLEDFAYAFFQNAFHLRDWIKNERPELKTQVDNLFLTTKMYLGYAAILPMPQNISA